MDLPLKIKFSAVAKELISCFSSVSKFIHRMSINLPYVEGTSEKLSRILRSHKIRPNFHTEKTLRKLLCKPKDPVAIKDKTILFMKLTIVTVKQSTSVNLNGL